MRSPSGAWKFIVLTAVSGLALLPAGCGFARYHSVPLAPAAAARRFSRRSLAAPKLRAYLERELGKRLPHWPLRVWTPRRLTLAALYYNPQLAAARANLALGQAGIKTAAERPNPSLNLGPGLETFPESPWAFRLAALLPLETAGKRAARIRVARRELAAIRLQAALAAWRVRADVRAALLQLLVSEGQQKLLQTAARHRAAQARVLRQRWQAGESARPPWLAAAQRATAARLALANARGQTAQARAGLAAAIGVPARCLRGLRFAWPEFQAPPAPATLQPARLRRRAELNRLDLRQALAGYAVAEAQLQSQIALQYPNLQLGPGWSYEEAHSIFRLALTLVLPVFNRNQGPIAQAAAQRNQLAAAFIALQAQDRAAAGKAWAGYRAAWAAWQSARRGARVAQSVRRAAQRIYRQGEAGRLSFSAARLQADAADQARWQALTQAQAALGALEDAVQQPLAPAWRLHAKVRKP